MIRRKFKIKHLNRFYVVWDLTVEQYFLISSDPEEGLKTIFSEFNDSFPVWLSQIQVDTLISNLFDFQENNKSKKNDTEKEGDQDWEIMIWHFMNVYKQQYTEIMKLPMRIFMKLYKVVEYVTWAKEYEKSWWKEPDKKAIRQALKNNNQVEWHK